MASATERGSRLTLLLSLTGRHFPLTSGWELRIAYAPGQMHPQAISRPPNTINQSIAILNIRNILHVGANVLLFIVVRRCGQAPWLFRTASKMEGGTRGCA